MASLNPTKLWLTDAKYLEDKRAVLLDFSRLNIRRNLLMPFFPSFYLSKERIEEPELNDFFSGQSKSFKVLSCETSFKVSAGSFGLLNEAANTVFRETGIKPVVLNPERQFLLEQNWSYFDCFRFFSDEGLSKVEGSGLPLVFLPFFSDALPETVSQLASADCETAFKLLEQVALSNLLKLPLADLSPHKEMHAEAFFENIFWQQQERTGNGLGSLSASNGRPLPSISDATLFDFSKLWPTILTRPFYNLGPDTIDCGCCRPSSIESSNVLPNSLVEAEFLQDGFYFDSSFPVFAKSFHEGNEGKSQRLRRKQEFFLQDFPVGPFDRHDRAFIPLNDALSLSEKRKVRILQGEKLHWFCLKKESSLSINIAGLQAMASSAESKSAGIESACFSQNGVNAVEILSCDVDFLFAGARASAFSGLLALIPEYLKNGAGGFFNSKVSGAFECIESLILSNFKSFTQKRGSRAFLLQDGNVLVRSERPLSLIEQFSEMQKVPALIRPRHPKKAIW
ncbi:MAG: hypothetical protein JW744_02395 [Candidatus Diapherotrites archaeon]|uniref:Uncharacterized protein n=1 Tax=Candidatus Iainarchaeum sp. TaxID=3101447 RepID=A0A939C8T4_9ARCH|nr:hypothetical protein [Candidatus Diapherotrites archaeon]